jgi:phosphate transport system protein
VRSSRAFLERDEVLARQIESDDARLDELETAVDQAVFALLYRQRPVAHDLRLAVVATKITTDLERIGDGAVTLSRCVQKLAAAPPVPLKTEVSRMSRLVSEMLHDATGSLLNHDVELLRAVILRDKELDRMHREMILELEQLIQAAPERTPAALQYILVARTLERMGDHAKNIAEEIIFMAEAVDIRHTQEGANQPAQA